MTAAAAPSARPARSVFTGADVCALAGLSLPGGSARPMFDDQMWDFTDVMGLPVQMQPAHRRFDFTAILDPGWRLVARELIMALLAPRHAAVAPLPRAYRTPLHLNTARGRLAELTRWLNWLTERGITSLGDVGEDCCQAYLAERRQVRDEHGVASCSPPAGPTRDCGRGAAPRPQPSPRCDAAAKATPPRRSMTPCCSPCWPPRSTW